MSTLKDVANYAKVSPSTVSRVLSGRATISPDTKKRVFEAIKALDYHPNLAARGLVTQNAQALGLVISGLEEFFDNSFFIQIMHGISQRALRAGYDLLLSSSTSDEAEVIKAWINGRRVDGLVFLRSYLKSPILEMVSKHRFPAVLIGTPPDGVTMDYVDNDNVRAAYEVTSYLIRRGHRRIGFLGGSMDLRVTRDRLEGYRMALNEAAIDQLSQFEVASFFLENGGYLGAMKLLASRLRPTAVLATDDVLALGLMRAANELGYRIPEDLSVIGFNNIPIGTLSQPPLTTVDIGTQQLGERATDLLLDRIQQNDLPYRAQYVPTSLVVRQSDRVLADISSLERNSRT